MVRGIVVAACLLVATQAKAETVYKCSEGGLVIYQSAPCSRGQREERVYGGTTYATTPQRQAQIERDRAQARQAVRRGSSAGTGTGHVRSNPPSRCEQVKAQRDSVMRQLGNRRTYEQISFWATEVSRACNHRR